MEKLQLTKTPKGKNEFLYQIIDANGAVITTRTSKRDYVAATRNGAFFFGRVDLIGKGEHGRYLKDFSNIIANKDSESQKKKFADRAPSIPYEKWIEQTESDFALYSQIAYLQQTTTSINNQL